MTTRIWRCVFIGLAVGVLGLLGCDVPSGEDSPEAPVCGVVVEEVADGSALAKAGLLAGDVVLRWERLPSPPANPGGDQGEMASPFDWLWVEVEQAPRGTVKLSGERDGESMAFVVEPGLWDTKVRPPMSGAMLDAYLKGRELIDAEQLEEGTSSWRQAAEMAQNDEDWPLRCWLWLRVGQVWAEARVWEKAEEAYELASDKARDPKAQVVVREASGDAFRKQSQWEGAQEAYRWALEIRKASWGETLGVVRNMNNIGLVAFGRGDLDRASFYFQDALDIADRMAPNSLELANSLNNLGLVNSTRGDFAGGEDYFQRALTITEKLAPNSLLLARIRNNLGIGAYERGDLAAAEDYYENALAIVEKLAPNTVLLAGPLNNLGNVALERGDLATAEGYFHRASVIAEKLAPNTLYLAKALGNLGVVASERGDLVRAEAYYHRVLTFIEELTPNTLPHANTFLNLGNLAVRRGDLDGAEGYFHSALAITEKVAPNTLRVARTLNNLGNLAKLRGDLDAAEGYYQNASAIVEKVEPNTVELANTLNNLGNVAGRRGNLDGAETYYQRASLISQKVAPNSLQLAAILNNLGSVARERRNLGSAEDYYRRSLAITERLAPNTAKEIEVLYPLAELFITRNRFLPAAEYLNRAIEALESQITRLGVSHEREGEYRADRNKIFRHSIEVALKRNRPDEAFHTLERFRARSLLAMLAERDLIFSADVPEDLDKDRKLLARRYDGILEQMATLDAKKDREAIDEFSKQLKTIQRERDEVVARIREASPRLADLQYPQPLTLPQVQKVLDPGTVMVSYSVGEDETHVFVVTSDQVLVAVETLAIGEEKLRARVDDFRRAIVHGTDPRSQFFEPVRDAGRELYKVVIRPVASSIEHGDRVLIIPDGPLHLLPFGALIRESGDYLAEWKPLHLVLSATLYGELQRARPQPADSPAMVAAFGDPVYPENLRSEKPDEIADVRVRAAVKRGLFDWKPLPLTRREVEEIAGLYPVERVHPYLGRDATEDRAKGLPRSTDIVHFAAHGYLDDRLPLNSAVVLTIPEGFPEDRDNGLLQAWEIFERVRIDADLVVLSACQSGLGEERGGEGLIGLTRAFQYAGARTVVATLWQVADEVTPELMVRFYRHLRAGKSKDAALQEAQIELIRGPIKVRKKSGKVGPRDASAPYYWAAFQVIGDWR